MKIRIEKDTRWSAYHKKATTTYYVWADDRVSAAYNTEEEARNAIDEIKTSYVKPSIETIYEEEI